jgi:hypothetical protein
MTTHGAAKTRGLVALGIGGAALAGGVVMLALSGLPSTDPDRGASVTPWVGYRAAGVTGRF